MTRSVAITVTHSGVDNICHGCPFDNIGCGFIDGIFEDKAHNVDAAKLYSNSCTTHMTFSVICVMASLTTHHSMARILQEHIAMSSNVVTNLHAALTRCCCKSCWGLASSRNVCCGSTP